MKVGYVGRILRDCFINTLLLIYNSYWVIGLLGYWVIGLLGYWVIVLNSAFHNLFSKHILM